MSYQTLQVRFQDGICFTQFNRPAANNTINQRMIEECSQLLELCESQAKVVVLSGTPEVFCFGADFQEISDKAAGSAKPTGGAEALYDLWLQLATGSYISIAYVRGKANAGGIGFVAASDIVIADASAKFSLSELLFGVMPACVMPFMIRRVGFQKAHYMTLMTQPVDVQQAHSWGVVDAWDADGEALLRRHLLRLRRLAKPAIARYKRYMSGLGELSGARTAAVAANREVFTDPKNIEGIVRYVQTGVFPWEA